MSSLSGSMGMGNKIPKGYKGGQIQQLTPQQMSMFSKMFGDIQNSPLQGLASGDQAAFDQIEAPALRQFGQLQGDIASRFSGMGMGGRKGSGFNNSMNTAASNFAQDLQSRRQQLMRQATQDLWGMSNDLLNQRPYENFLVKKPQRPSFLQSLLGGVAPVAGAAIGGTYGGPQGAAMGANIGSQFGSAFSGGQPQQTDWSQMAGLSTDWSQ